MRRAALAALLCAAVPLPASAQEGANGHAGEERRLLGAPRLLGDATGPVALLGPASSRQPLPEFLARQLAAPHVFETRLEVRFALRELFRARGLDYPPRDLYLRVFKQEQLVEVWVRPDDLSRYVLLRTYPMCTLPGRLGPKRREGDFQVPEGFYFIDVFNPESRYRLSLGIDYPNVADRLRAGPDAEPLGGEIFIHGGCATEGCVPLDDADMRELYLLAVETRAAGQHRIPVHVFPTRLSPEGLSWLKEHFSPDRGLLAFWQDLQQGFAYFEETGAVPVIAVTELGRYTVWSSTEEAAARRADVARRLPPLDLDAARPGAPGPRP